MKFYVASSFTLIEKVEKVVKALELAGHTITVKWWDREYHIEGEGLVNTQVLKKRFNELQQNDFYSKPETKFSFESDFKGVIEADVFLFVADDTPRKYNGANVELGIALANYKLCLSVGVLENSVLYYPIEKFKEIDEVLDFLRG